MTAEIVERVLRSSRYRDVDRSLLARFAAEELPRARNTDDAVKRVKRRLHQAVGAFRGVGGPFRLAGSTGALVDPALRSACADAMGSHASTRERVPHLDAFYAGIWAVTGIPHRVMDLGCGLNPLALPWMGLGDATYLASDVDGRPLETVRQFLELVGQPHRVDARDLVSGPPADAADVVLLLKLVTTLDRQDPGAATRLLDELRVRHAVISFPKRSLGGRAKGLERTYRQRFDRLVADSTRVRGVVEASVPNELVFVVALDG
jgi:16S rRNA (guanine(1405)-N(7))-methyltransferase